MRLLPVLPFLLTCLLPVGLMPAATTDGTLTLVICTQGALELRSVPAPDDEQSEASERCLFALHATAFLLPATVRAAEPLAFAALVARVGAPPCRRAAICASPKPRGPPVIL
jgi:hypothetical protein